MVEKATALTSAAYAISILKISDLTGGHDLSWPFMCVSIMFTKEASKWQIRVNLGLKMLSDILI